MKCASHTLYETVSKASSLAPLSAVVNQLAALNQQMLLLEENNARFIRRQRQKDPRRKSVSRVKPLILYKTQVTTHVVISPKDDAAGSRSPKEEEVRVR